MDPFAQDLRWSRLFFKFLGSQAMNLPGKYHCFRADFVLLRPPWKAVAKKLEVRTMVSILVFTSETCDDMSLCSSQALWPPSMAPNSNSVPRS